MCAPSHLRSSHLRSSYHILYLRICIRSAHLIYQIFISDLSIFTFIFRSSYFETTSCLHTVGSSSRSHTVLSYHLQDFIMQLLSQFYNLIYLRIQNFISALSGQPSSSSFLAFLRKHGLLLSGWPSGLTLTASRGSIPPGPGCES